MTLEFDKKAIDKEKKQLRLFDILTPNGDSKPKELTVKKVPASRVRQFIASYHYSNIMPDNAFECFMGFYGDKMAGVVVFGNGANNETFRALIPDMELKNCRELTRLWSPDGMPKNTETRLIKESIKLLPEEIKMIVSFADPSQNHNGIIYQASNFHYCGMSKPSKMLLNEEGKKFHIRTIGSYKRRHPELRGLTNKEILKLKNWKYCESSGKHRYVMLRGEKWIKNLMYEKIKDRILPYPKK